MDASSASTVPIARTPAPASPSGTRPAQLALACLILLSMGLLGLHAVRNASWLARPTELSENQDTVHRLDLNHASKAELLQVPGIGEKTVDKILDFRERQRFRSVEDLLQVGGIGQPTL